MRSILEDYALTVDRLEAAIAVGRSRAQILAMFNKTPAELDEFCLREYGHPFRLVHEWVRQCTIERYLEAVHDMGMRGNPSALGIIDRAIQKDESMSATRIVFVSSLPGEGDEEKRDDGDQNG